MTIKARKACTADDWNHFKKDDDCKTSMCPTGFLDAVRRLRDLRVPRTAGHEWITVYIWGWTRTLLSWHGKTLNVSAASQRHALVVTASVR